MPEKPHETPLHVVDVGPVPVHLSAGIAAIKVFIIEASLGLQLSQHLRFGDRR
jgi:hypothetical protein